MQNELGNRRPDCQQAQFWSTPSELGIAAERARQQIDGDGGAQAVTGDHNFIGIGAPGAGDHPVGE